MRPRLLRRHDRFVKRLLDQPGVADSLFRTHLPPDIVGLLADAPLQRVPGSFVAPTLRESRTDRLFRASMRDGRPIFLYGLVEHKSTPDPLTGPQLLTYVTRIIWWWIETEGKPRAGRPPPLPAVISLILYNGRTEWTLPVSLAGGMDIAPALRPYLVDFRFTVLDLGRTPDARLGPHPRLRTGLLLLRLGGQRRPLPHLLPRLARIAAAFGDDDLIALIAYLFGEIGPDEQGLLETLLAELLPEKKETVMQTIADHWIAQGKQEGRAAVVLNLLNKRFSDLPTAVIVRVQNASAAEIDAWSLNILDARTLDDVFRS